MEYQLLEDFLNGQSTDSDRKRVELIRVLGRSVTLPKVADLQVQYIQSQPEMFLMDPGKQLRIGVRLLEHPVLALLALRYGLEWHIWYKAMNNQEVDCRVADLAAARVAIKFIELLPDSDRKALDEHFPDDLKPLYKILKNPDFSLSDFEKLDSYVLANFHKMVAPKRAINRGWLSIIEQLAVPTESLLMSGGDQRLTIDTATLLNKYGCRPFPRPEAYTFASSTATSVSNIAFDLTQKHRERLILDAFKHGLYDTFLRQQVVLVQRLKEVLNISKKAAVVLAPSGTDIALLFAGICQASTEKPIAHILVASDETGSGVPAALRGTHFADTSALMQNVQKGEMVKGFRNADVLEITIRSADGSLKSSNQLDLEIKQTIVRALDQGKQVVLHVMDQSKLGYASPSEVAIEEIRHSFGNQVWINVDNSQLRMKRKRLEDYVRNGYFMTITGSKFFTGPPFSGALVIPHHWAQKLVSVNKTLPVGFEAYYYQVDFNLEGKLKDTLAKGFNMGSQLRWLSAITEMERYYRVPLTLRNLGAELFCKYVEQRIANTPFLEALHQHDERSSIPLAPESRTIFPFFILNNGKVLTRDEADRMYRLLNQDVSNLLSTGISDEDLRVARQACHIGQPVKVRYKDGTQSAVVRISLGSRVIAESWKDRDVSLFFQRIEGQMNQVDAIIRKIELILNADKLSINELSTKEFDH
jgi:hypothetical protein